ncbi:phospholipid transporting ATPase [Dipsacomyces acuminosporus]|nr:phospholipid transporting ATPase [Dipsacomyces acuminosporus]
MASERGTNPSSSTKGQAASRSWFKRILSRRGGSSATQGAERTIYLNAALPAHAFDERGRPTQYPPNHIRTAKYTVLSFVPKNLFEQFHRVANIYFLFLLILQFVPGVTNDSPGLSAFALVLIIALTMAKDGYEDSKRSASDKEANKAPVVVLGGGWVNANKPPGHFLRPRGVLRFLWSDSGAEGTVGGAIASHVPPAEAASTSDTGFGSDRPDAMDGESSSDRWLHTEWRHVHVGDIVMLREDDPVPADLLILSTSEGDGTCFIETKNLDGETNLKSKQAPARSSHIASPQQLAGFKCVIEAEPPSTQLYAFKGTLQVLEPAAGAANPSSSSAKQAEKDPLNIDNLLLRGSVLRNTRWVVGVTVFTGNDTKIMMNSGETPSKRSRIERTMNYQVLSQFCLLFILCLASSICGGIYYGKLDSFQDLFIVRYQTGSNKSPAFLGFMTFWSSLILYQTLVPISLYVTIEIVKSYQAYFINQDLDMYYAPRDRRCIPKSWNLSDDLGQVEYIFSDKTGTLTQNVMEFRQCTIRGRVYGEIVGADETEKADELREAMQSKMQAFFSNPYRQNDTATFLDTTIHDDLKADNTQSRAVIEFFTVLSLCHTVITETPDPARPEYLVYKAQSPDEAALVSTARDVGFTFVRRDKDRLHCNFLGHEQTYTLLATLEFTSARKRMSVIVRREDGRVMLLCKGADSVIMERIKDSQESLRQATLDDLELFASHGLRTLCLGYRILEEGEYSVWKQDYDKAIASLGDRESEVEAVCDRIERELRLIGGTAIEDKLQDGVPETIAQLARAGIKLWVLTGDKTETAINIGYSCNLLNNDMQLVVVQSDDKESTRAQLERALHEFGDTHADLSYRGGGGGAMSGVPKRSTKSWRSLLRSSGKESATNQSPYKHAREIAQDKNRRHGLRGVWDDVRTRNIPVARRKTALKRDAPLALVIDGQSLKYALEDDLSPLLLEIAVRCKSVICCRVSPLQKALVVRLVKEALGTLCLSIGDGANDVSMIQEADVGIGISGEEGLQAVMASDYAIAQFRFLQKLLLVHGRWSYLRISSMILNFFYKNSVFTVTLFWFQFFCQWSANNFLDYALISLYNMFFTAFPPGVLGVFDQDLPAAVGMVVPQLYKRGIYKLEYSMARFWMYIVDGIYQSAVITLLVVYTYYFSATAQSNGLDGANKDDIGTVGAFCVILTTNLYMGFNNRTWTWVMPAAQLLGVALLLVVFFVYGAAFTSSFSAGAAVRIFAQIDFWLLILLSVVTCLLPHFIAKFVRTAWYPTDTDIISEIARGFKKGSPNVDLFNNGDDIPLDDIGSGRRKKKHHPDATDPVIQCLQRVSQAEDASSAPAGNILKRLSVYQKNIASKRKSAVDGDGDGISALRRVESHVSEVSTRSSIYYLDDGSVEPYTGYAFAQESSLSSRKKK